MPQRENKHERLRKKQEGLDTASLEYFNTQNDLIQIKNNLDEFSKSLYDFFLDGFPLDDSQEEKVLERSPEYPPEYVLQNILTQTSFDIEVIRNAISQRNNPAFSGRLKQLDALAINALQHFIPQPENIKPGRPTGIIKPVRPYVYFNRDTNVRVIPYANALFIGVPMSALTENGDLPAIAHEVGHHIYKNGKIGKKTLDVYFKEYFEDSTDIVAFADRWILNWLEEIFADLCSVISAGPVAALTIQDILEDNLTEDLKKDDGVHPPGYIRPYVYIEILKLALQDAKTDQDAVNQLISQLEERWGKAREDRGLLADTKFKTFKDPEQIGESDESKRIIALIEETVAGERIAEVVQRMNQELRNNFEDPFYLSIPSNGTDKTWSHLSPVQKGEPVDLDAIYESFDRYIKGLDVEKIIGKLESSQQPEYWADIRKNEWDPNKKFEYQTRGQIEVTPEDRIKTYFQTLKWSEIFGDTRPVSGPE